jgi:hypothetical protein
MIFIIAAKLKLDRKLLLYFFQIFHHRSQQGYTLVQALDGNEPFGIPGYEYFFVASTGFALRKRLIH